MYIMDHKLNPARHSSTGHREAAMILGFWLSITIGLALIGYLIGYRTACALGIACMHSGVAITILAHSAVILDSGVPVHCSLLINPATGVVVMGAGLTLWIAGSFRYIRLLAASARARRATPPPSIAPPQ